MSIQIVEIAQPSVIDTVAVAQPSTVAVVEVRQGPAGMAGLSSITSATTSDGTADLSISNLTTATAEVTGTLTANHIHGNLAGSVYAHVRAGENLAKGDPVYVSGSHGSGATLIAEVSKADASNAAKMPAVGIMDAAVLANANGHMVITGTITELATNAYTVNAELYVAAGGGMTATPPNARAQPVARVERANLNNGAILVKVNGLSASDATPSTLVRRTSEGGASFGPLSATAISSSQHSISSSAGTTITGPLTLSGTGSNTLAATYSNTITLTGTTGVTIAGGTLTFNSSGFAYGVGGAAAHRTALGSTTTGDALFVAADAAAARTAIGATVTGSALITATNQAGARSTGLGSGATGDALFTAASASAARTTLELGAFSTNGSITGTGALTFTSASASNINLTPGTTGFIDIAKASATGSRESILRAKVSDGSDDAFHIYNGTSVDGRFTPGFSGSAFSASAQRALQFVAQTTAANDTGTTPLMSFESRRTSSTTDPNNGTLSDITTRPLFEWRNITGSLATMAPSGALSLLATTASTSTTTGALVVSGGVGIAGAVNSLYQRVGAGSPEGVVTAPVGAIYHRTNGGAGTSFYVKESGTGNTGWVAK